MILSEYKPEFQCKHSSRDAGTAKGQGEQIVLNGHFDRETIDYLNICGPH